MAEYRFQLNVTQEDEQVQTLSIKLASLLREHFDNVDLEVKNFFNNGHSSEAMEYGVFSIPALLKMNPEPAAVLVGDLDGIEKIKAAEQVE